MMQLNFSSTLILSNAVFELSSEHLTSPMMNKLPCSNICPRRALANNVGQHRETRAHSAPNHFRSHTYRGVVFPRDVHYIITRVSFKKCSVPRYVLELIAGMSRRAAGYCCAKLLAEIAAQLGSMGHPRNCCTSGIAAVIRL